MISIARSLSMMGWPQTVPLALKCFAGRRRRASLVATLTRRGTNTPLRDNVCS